MGIVAITNFQTAGVDQIELDISLIGVIMDGTDTTTIVDATAVTLEEVSDDETMIALDAVFVLTGSDFATAALAEAAIEDGGTRELISTEDFEANDVLIIVWSDGSNSYVGEYTVSAAVTAGDNLTGDLTTMVQLVGVVASTASTLTIANFDFVA
jgi:hypothetical protein